MSDSKLPIPGMSEPSTSTVAGAESGERIVIHGQDAFGAMRAAGRLAAETLDFIAPHVQPGVSTGKLDRLCANFIRDNGAIAAPLNYRGFPKSICTSVNHVVCHGIPDEAKLLADGDILNIDVTVILDGWHGDTSRMYFAGDVGVKAKRLVTSTYDAMMAGIAVVRPGATLGDIGHAIQTLAEAQRLSVVRDFCGHGIGKVFHDAPSVLHYGHAGTGLKLQQGMFFTIEPMITVGAWRAQLWNDGWTATTIDLSRCAQNQSHYRQE